MQKRRWKKTKAPKAKAPKLVDQLKDEPKLRFELFLAKELHMTLRDLRERVTEEELMLWSSYYELENKEQEQARRRAMNRRR